LNSTRVADESSTGEGRALSAGRALTQVPRLSAADWAATGPLVRWLVAVRAPVLVMTFSSAATGGLLALRDARAGTASFDALGWLLCALGLLLAHATNNLLNDWTDSRRGVDKGNYFRNRYGTHPLEQGFVGERTMGAWLLSTGGAALAIGLYLVARSGTVVLWPLVPGAICLLFYTWPFKKWGLGEPAVLATWGPLMVGGTYLVSTGRWDADALWAGLLAGLGPSVVIFGKHIDKLEMDREKGVYTLPVRLGEARSRMLLAALALAQFPLAIVLVATGTLPWTVLVVGATVPSALALVRQAQAPRPAERPADWPEAVWPLWFVAAAFAHTRLFGPLLLAGLLAGWALGV
jgi:1,4-dihydroxy-2-naphthoate octaprenyltransferase